jgi:inosine/xanthosine triphosphatase
MEQVVLVASKNPVKTEAIREAFEKVFPQANFKVVSADASSGISDQPMGISQTLQGAVNRIDSLVSSGKKASFYVSIEGGVADHKDDLFAFAWVVIRNASGYVSKSQTGHFPLPHRIKTLLKQGLELGHATDQVFGLHNSKQNMGAVGVLTGQAIDRKAYYVHAVILALIPFIKTELFSTE